MYGRCKPTLQFTGVKEGVQTILNDGWWTRKHISHLRHEIDDRTEAATEGTTLSSGGGVLGISWLFLCAVMRLGHFLAT